MNYPEKIDKIPLVCKSIKKVFNDVEYDKTHNKYRVFKDKSTEIFTKHFISNPKTDITHKRLLSFIDYIFNAINAKIMLNLNNELSKNNFKTMGNEQVFLLFKGGNNLVVLQDMFEKITEKNHVNVNSMPSKIKSNIKISDNDFVINIIAENENRFNEIYFCVKKLLTHSLLEICEIFNNLMFNMEGFKILKPNPNLIFKPHLLDSYNNNLILSYYYPFTNEKTLQDFSVFDELEKLDVEYCNNIGTLIQTEFIRSCYKNNNEQRTKILNRIEQLLNHKLSYFYDNIYNADDIKLFKEELASEVNEMTSSEKLFYDLSGQCINHYKVVGQVEPDKLQFSETQNIFIFPSNTFNNQIFGSTIKSYIPILNNRNVKNAHYMTINGTIYGNTTKVGFNFNFDLFRIKCNVLADQPQILYKYCEPNNVDLSFKEIFIPALFKLPSEFVDVSIGHYDDSNIVSITEDYYNGPKKFIYYNLHEFKNYSLENFRSFSMYSSELIVNDLINTLFKSTYAPQFNLKYNKRLVRLFYFYCMFNIIRDNSSDKLCEILTLIKTELMKISNSMSNSINNNPMPNNVDNNSKKLVNISPNPSFNTTFYDVPYSFDILVNYSLGRPLSDFVNVKKENTIIQPLLNYFLAYKTIFESDANYITYFTQYYNQLYNIIDNTTPHKLFISYQLILSECIEIIDYCLNMFCSKSPHPEDEIYNYVTTVYDNNKINTLIKTEEENKIKYSYLINNEVTFSFEVPNITVDNDIERCKVRCRGNNDEELCCDDKNKKYEALVNEYNKIPDGSEEKEKMYQLLNIFFKDK